MRFKIGDKLIRRFDNKIYTVLSIGSCGIKGFPYYKCSADDTRDAKPVYLNDMWEGALEEKSTDNLRPNEIPKENPFVAITSKMLSLEYAKPTCECGMEKHGFANHSTWCAKYGS